MKNKPWMWTAIILCAVGVCKEFRPSEPFLLDYAVEFRNFTNQQLTHEIFPYTTGGYIISLVVLLLITDTLCYKPVIVLGGAASIISWSLTIWWYGQVSQAQTRQIINSISIVSTDVAYFTYMYSNVEKSSYKKVTSYSHTAVHTGQFLSGLVGQLLISFHLLNLEGINYLSLGGATLGFVIAIFLPRITRAPRKIKNQEFQDASQETDSGFRQKFKSVYLYNLDHIKYAYTNTCVVKWSLWWIFAYSLYLQVDIYAEPLWKEVEEEAHRKSHHQEHQHQHILNGAVHASHSFLSAVLSMGIAFVKFPWRKWGHVYLGCLTILQGAALLWMSYTGSLYTAYGCFILFQTCFQVLVLIIRADIAEGIKEGGIALIFGLNTLAAVLVQAVITFSVTSQHGFQLPIRKQFIVYGVYSAILGFLFLCLAVKRKGKSWNVKKASEEEEMTTESKFLES